MSLPKPSPLPTLRSRPMWRRVLAVMADLLITAIVFATMAVLVLETISGCGESYVDSKGVTHRNECIFK